jgi:cytochrome P450 PksS
MTPIDLSSPAFKADPFPTMARLRAQEPVHLTAVSDGTPVWLVTRYADVLAMLQDGRFVKDRRRARTAEELKREPWIPKSLRPLERNMLDVDPPDHTRLRALVQKAFTPRLIERMRPRVEALCHELLEAMARRGKADLVADFALPLPITIISEMLGVPERERARFHRWSNAIISIDTPGAAGAWRVLPQLFLFVRFLRRFFRRRRAEPGDDLASALLQAEESGDALDGDELLAMVFLLLVAGHETTVHLIGSGAAALLEHPDQAERLRNEPALVWTAVEELLRYTSPVFLTTERYAREPVTLHGTTIPRGGLSFGALGSANRDEAVFDHSDRLDLARSPNKHLAFGHGIHYCLGAPLARLEAGIALSTLFRRLPDLRLSLPAARLRWKRSLVLRGLESLPVETGPARG